MDQKVWSFYAPIYEKAMRADQKLYEFMYSRTPQVIEGKEVLEIANQTGDTLCRRLGAVIQKMEG